MSCPRAALSSLQILGTVGVSQKASRAFAHPSRWRRSSSPRRAASRASRPRSIVGALVAPRPSPRAASPSLPPHMVRVPSSRYFSRAPDHRSPPDPFDRAHPVPPPPTTPTTLRPPRRTRPLARALPHDDAREHRVVEDRGGREGERGRRARGRRDGQGDDGARVHGGRVPRQDRRPGRRVRPGGRHRRRRHGRGRGGRRGVRELRRRPKTTDATKEAPGGGPGAPAGCPPAGSATAAPARSRAGSTMALRAPPPRRERARPATIRATGPKGALVKGDQKASALVIPRSLSGRRRECWLGLLGAGTRSAAARRRRSGAAPPSSASMPHRAHAALITWKASVSSGAPQQEKASVPPGTRHAAADAHPAPTSSKKIRPKLEATASKELANRGGSARPLASTTSSMPGSGVRSSRWRSTRSMPGEISAATNAAAIFVLRLADGGRAGATREVEAGERPRTLSAQFRRAAPRRRSR